MELTGKNVLVTGGAVRIGRAICEAFAAAGARVVIHARRSAAEAEELAGRLRSAGGSAWVVGADLDDPAQASGLVAQAAAAAGPLDILVNNAAVFHKDSLDSLDAAKLEAEFRANLFAPLLLMQAFAAQGRPGRIVNLLDRRIEGLDTACAPYVLTKKALAEATRLAALAWAPRITVNGVAPGAVLPPPGEGAAYLRDHAGFIPLGRLCTPAEVAEAVLFAARSEAMTGQVLFVDGGQHLGGA